MELYKNTNIESLDGEVWHACHVGYEGFYEISNYGRVKSLSRLVNRGDGLEVTKEKILSQRIDSCGYCLVGLYYAKKKQKLVKVHRLIAQSFIPNPYNKKCVNHKNGIKTDNNVGNLEWSTYQENTIHARDNGLLNPQRGENNATSVLKDDDVLAIRELAEKGYTNNELGVMFGVSRRNISMIVSRTTWKHI